LTFGLDQLVWEEIEKEHTPLIPSLSTLMSVVIIKYLKKTKKCSHRADVDEILLILGKFHELGLIKRGDKFQAFWCYQMTQILTNT
jgi:hypothetical protein